MLCVVGLGTNFIMVYASTPGIASAGRRCRQFSQQLQGDDGIWMAPYINKPGGGQVQAYLSLDEPPSWNNTSSFCNRHWDRCWSTEQELT